MIGIYKIISPSGKIYIGQSWDIKRRFMHYKGLNCKAQKILYNSLHKYGYEAHKFQILLDMPLNSTQEHLNYAELYFWKIETFKGSILMNSISPGSGGKSSNATKLKQSKSMKGKVHKEETKEKIRIARTLRPNRGGIKNKGKVRSLENRIKISNSLKARQDNKGEKHNMSKLTERQVIEIREKYIPKVYSAVKLGKEYGISKTNVLYIIKRKIWNNI